MSDTDILDILFDASNGLINEQFSQESGVNNKLSSVSVTAKHQDSVGKEDNIGMVAATDSLFNFDLDPVNYDFDWGSVDLDDMLKPLMDSNLPDDLKEQQHMKLNDHAYSVNPSSPNSDSGISNGPCSPANSSKSSEDAFQTDLDRELWLPFDLKSYEPEDVNMVDASVLSTFSDSNSSPGQESPLSLDFEDYLENSSVEPVSDLTVSTDETTKAIKVITINNRKLQSVSGSVQTQSQVCNGGSPYPMLVLSDEEKDLLRKERITLPTHLPLTREEEKVLRSVRRRIRNKASARNSRRKKQDYMEALEQRVKICTDEKVQLERKVNALEKQNSSLIGQLKKLQKLVADSTRQTARTGTCAMILALSFALVLLPNYQSFSSEQETLKSQVSGRTSRSLLSKPEEIINPANSLEDSISNIPFFSFMKPVTPVSAAKQLIDEPVEDLIEQNPVEAPDENSELKTDVSSAKTIHMEITQLPEDDATTRKNIENTSANSYPEEPRTVIRHRAIRMDLDDEL